MPRPCWLGDRVPGIETKPKMINHVTKLSWLFPPYAMLPGRAGQAATTTSPSPSLSSISAAHATTLEDALHDCFESLGRYDYQSSHRVIRVNAQVFHQAHHFPQLSSVLSRITSCESLYSSYAYMKQKWFKKDVRLFALSWVGASVVCNCECRSGAGGRSMHLALSSNVSLLVSRDGV